MVSTTYSTGSWLGIVRSGSLIVLERGTDPAIVGALWDYLGQEPTIHGVLNEVTAKFGTVLTSMPPFAIVLQNDRLHVILRGSITLLASTDEGTERVSGQDVATWSERSLPFADSIELVLDESEPGEDVLVLPLGEGVVRLRSLLMLADGAVAAVSQPSDVELATPEMLVAELPVAEAEADTVVDAAVEPELDAETGADSAEDAEPAPEAPAESEDVAADEEVEEAEGEEPAFVEPEDLVAEAVESDERAVEPEVLEQDLVEVDSAEIEAVEADVAETDSAELDAAELDTVEADVAEADSVEQAETEREPSEDEPTEAAIAAPGLLAAADGETDVDVTDEPGVADAAELTDTEFTSTHDPIDPEYDEEALAQFAKAAEAADAEWNAQLASLEGPDALDAFITATGGLTSEQDIHVHDDVLENDDALEDDTEEAAAETPDVTASEVAPSDLPEEQEPSAQPVIMTHTVPPMPSLPPTSAGILLDVADEHADAEDSENSDDSDDAAAVSDDVDQESLETEPEPGDEVAAPQPEARPITGTLVLARLCSNGHANPPNWTECFDCGALLDSEPREVGRPRLGSMHISSGEVVDLDHSLIIGRQPSVSQVLGGAMPQLVQVVSANGDISRSHVEVRLDQWEVVLVDLNATNGTVLVRAGQEPHRLEQGEEAILHNGDIAELGDGISLTFEGLL